MKKLLCLVMVLVLGLSLAACGVDLEKVEESIQGEWVIFTETQVEASEKLSINDGSVTKSVLTSDGWTTLSGTYVIDSDGFAVVTYSDGSQQTLASYIVEDGYALRDVDKSAYYVKAE